MKRGVLTLGLLLGFAQFVLGQTNRNGNQVNLEKTPPDAASMSYLVSGATADQETLLRSEIQAMHPEVLPLRIFLVPHWKYVDTARTFRLHVPTGMSSVMFTHLASRTIFIDTDRYLGAEWLGYWMAHELGHLVTNSVDERERNSRTAPRTESYDTRIPRTFLCSARDGLDSTGAGLPARFRFIRWAVQQYLRQLIKVTGPNSMAFVEVPIFSPLRKSGRVLWQFV